MMSNGYLYCTPTDKHEVWADPSGQEDNLRLLTGEARTHSPRQLAPRSERLPFLGRESLRLQGSAVQD